MKWRSVPTEHEHGVFRSFSIDITEKLQDGIILLRRIFPINKTEIQQMKPQGGHFIFDMALNLSRVSTTSEVDVNETSTYFYLELVGLRAYASYNITISSCTTPGCGQQCSSVFTTNERGDMFIIVFQSLPC